MEHEDTGYVKGGSATDITYSLKGVVFPAEKRALIQYAQQHSANKVVMDRLDKIEDRVYEDISDVTKQVGTAA